MEKNTYSYLTLIILEQLSTSTFWLTLLVADLNSSWKSLIRQKVIFKLILADIKGGTLIEYEDGIRLLEIAQVPAEHVLRL